MEIFKYGDSSYEWALFVSKLCPFVEVEIIQNNVEITVMERNIIKYTWEIFEYLVITPT
jgi:hypothetical protein